MTFFFTLLFMFLVYWRPQDWLVPQMFGWPLLDIVTVFALGSLLLEVEGGRIKFPKQLPQVYLLIGVWIATLLSHVANTYFAGLMATLPETLKLCFFSLLLLCVLDSPQKLRTVARLLVAMSLFMAVHAILMEERGHGFGPAVPFFVPAYGDNAAQWRTQFYGIFSDSNDLAQTLAVSIPFSFVMFKGKRALSLVVGCLCTYILYRGIETTYSDGGMIALFGVASVMVVMFFPARWIPYLLGIGVVAGLLMCPFAGPMFDESAHDRVVFWGYANAAFLRHPIFGVGYNMFWQVADDRAAHNAFVECYTEVGLLGYWNWFGLLLLGAMGCWRGRRLLVSQRHEGGEQRYMYAFTGMALAALVGMASSSYFLTRAFHFPTFFLFALLAAVPRVVQSYRPGGGPLIRLDQKTVILLTAGAVGSVFYIYVSILLLNRLWGG